MPNGITELIRKGNKYQSLDILKLGDELRHIHTIESKFHTMPEFHIFLNKFHICLN